MRVVVQRVSRARVSVRGERVGEVGRGLFVLVGVGRESTVADARWLADKVQGLRLFTAPGADGATGPMDASVAEIGGGVLAISQFTLYGDTRKGRRPSFIGAAAPEQAEPIYEAFCAALSVPVARGVFGAHMVIEAAADGPVTLVLQREAGVNR